MSVAAFVNPASERVEDDDEKDLQHIAEQETQAYSQEETLADLRRWNMLMLLPALLPYDCMRNSKKMGVVSLSGTLTGSSERSEGVRLAVVLRGLSMAFLQPIRA